MSFWTDINKWIQKYWGAWVKKIVSSADAVWNIWSRIWKATIDTWTLIWGELVKLPGEVANIWGEIYKFWKEAVTWKEARETAIDRWHERINKTVDDKTRSQMLTIIPDKELETARDVASFVLPFKVTKGKKALTAGKEIVDTVKSFKTIKEGKKLVAKLNKIAEKLILKAQKTLNVKDVQKAKVASKEAMDTSKQLRKEMSNVKDTSKTNIQESMFSKFLSKDKKIKKTTGDLKDLQKRFNKVKKSLTPEQIALMEKGLLEKQKVIDVLISKGKTKIAVDIKKKLKLDKDIDKIVNPKVPMGKINKTLIGLGGVAALGWVVAMGMDKWEEDLEVSEEWTTDGKNILVDTETKETGKQTIDTAWEETDGSTNVVPKKDDSTITTDSSKAKESEQIIQTWGSFMDKQGVNYPVYLQWWAYKLKWPTGKVYILETWITNANKLQKYKVIWRRALPWQQ